MKKLMLPLCIAAIMAWFFQPVYTNGTECNWFILWILIGIPFGVRRMFLLMPRGYDIGATIGFTAFSFIIGGLIGGVILIYDLADGLFHLVFRRLFTV